MIVFIPGLSVLLTHFFLLIRRKKFVTLNSWILFLGIIAVAYLSRFGQIESIDYSGLIVPASSEVKGKRIAVLGDAIGMYNQNTLATPYLNWNLSQKILRHPEYYDNVTHVYHAFKNDPPDIVFDKENLLSRFFDRMPDVKAIYVCAGDRYLRKVSN